MTAFGEKNRELVRELIRRIPKVELHLHIEGTFEPELLFAIATRNGIPLKYESVEALRNAYDFNNLQEFLDIYYQGMNALQKEEDYFDLTYAYFKRVHADHVRHAEIFFDPQGHTDRGVAFETVVKGIQRGMKQAKADFGITSHLILSFLRHLTEEAAFATLEQAKPFLQDFVAVGLDSSEVGHPPSKFERVFAKSRDLGLKAVAHAGEEGDPSYVWEALKLLKVDRVDHGVRSLEDPELVAYLVERAIPLTVCPNSNLKLKVVKDMKDHNLLKLLAAGLKVTVNSDDPAYFGGYMNDNFAACHDALNTTAHDVLTMAHNAIDASFISGAQKVVMHQELQQVAAEVEAKFYSV